MLAYATPADDVARPRSRRWLAAMLWLGAAASVAALVAILVVGVETVLITGPILLVAGLATVVLAARVGAGDALAVGVVQVFAPIGAFTVIWWNRWGPDESRSIVLLASALCCLAVLARGIRQLERWSASTGG